MTTNKVVLKAKFCEVSQIVDKILKICWNDLKFSHVIYDSTHKLRTKNLILLSAMEFVEFHGIKECVQNAIFGEKLLYIHANLIWLKMV